MRGQRDGDNRTTLGRFSWQPLSIEEHVSCGLVGRIEQPNDNPGIRKLMKVPNIEMRIVLLDHLCFVTLAKLGFPVVTVLAPPMTIGFAHFPVGANHIVAGAKNLFTSKLVAEIERNFFKLLYWSLLE